MFAVHAQGGADNACQMHMHAVDVLPLPFEQVMSGLLCVADYHTRVCKTRARGILYVEASCLDIDNKASLHIRDTYVDAARFQASQRERRTCIQLWAVQGLMSF